MTEWRYLAYGRVVHALDRLGVYGGTSDTAACGTTPSWFRAGWLGTGSQAEYETAERLPKCIRCQRAMGVKK